MRRMRRSQRLDRRPRNKPILRDIRIEPFLVRSCYPRRGPIRPVVLWVLRQLTLHKHLIGEELMKRKPKPSVVAVFWYDDRTARALRNPWGGQARRWDFNRYPFLGATYLMREKVQSLDSVIVMVIPRKVMNDVKESIRDYSGAAFLFLLHELTHAFLGTKSETQTDRVVKRIFSRIVRSSRHIRSPGHPALPRER
mgnify:CR=1 FL=1